MYIPETLAKELRKRGIDEYSLVDAIVRFLNIDPSEAAKAHAELAMKSLNEGLGLVEKNDVVQASEKLYKAVEEAIKALAIVRGLREAEEAMNTGRWTVVLLDRAARELGDEVWRAWTEAYFLHVNGFHETRIDIDAVKARLSIIEKIINTIRQYIVN